MENRRAWHANLFFGTIEKNKMPLWNRIIRLSMYNTDMPRMVTIQSTSRSYNFETRFKSVSISNHYFDRLSSTLEPRFIPLRLWILRPKRFVPYRAGTLNKEEEEEDENNLVWHVQSGTLSTCVGESEVTLTPRVVKDTEMKLTDRSLLKQGSFFLHNTYIKIWRRLPSRYI
jgi:hypothetical protein